MSRANCRRIPAGGYCWVSLEDGFLVPVDAVKDLLPPLAGGKDEGDKGSRPDLIYVTAESRRGLVFRFLEVKYGRHLRTARSPDILERIDRQTRVLRERWYRWYGHQDVCDTFRAIRRAKLARVLHFYADKARRHGMPPKRHKALVTEIDRMIARGEGYAFADSPAGDRGWVFCPEYAGTRPLRISPGDWNTQVFMFGPALLPDSDFGFEAPPSESLGQAPAVRSTSGRAEPEGGSKSREADSVEGSADDRDVATSDNDDSVPAIRLGANTLANAAVNWRLGVDGNPHLLIAGLPGMGKTTCLVNLCEQMVAASIRPLVFSYHQDIDDRDFRRGTSCCPSQARSDDGEGMPQIRNLIGVGIPGSAGFRCFRVFGHRQLSRSPLDRYRREIPRQERLEFETGAGSDRPDQADEQIQCPLLRRRKKPTFTRGPFAVTADGGRAHR